MEPYYQDDSVTLYHGDALDVARELPAGGADCIVTSPPYFGLRDYGTEGQYGLESSPSLYVARMRRLFSELHRVLADDGTLWLNIGDSYSATQRHSDNGTGATGLTGTSPTGGRWVGPRLSMDRPAKNLLGIPWRVAFALQDDGWILRNAIIWHKANAMPESVTDRLSGRYEHVFMFSKSRRYWFDLDPIRDAHTEESFARAAPHRAQSGKSAREGLGFPSGVKGQTGRLDQMLHPQGRNPGDVWTLPTQPFSAAHFAVMPVQLAQRCILAGCKPGGTVLDPFSGSGTTGLAAQRTGRKYIGIDLSREYLDLSLRTRLNQSALDFDDGQEATA